jgi:hypothetical protein
MLVLQPPVPGPIVRPFAYAGSPFARGLHRGVDLRAAEGEAVRAPCAGPVVYAGAKGVTLLCAGRRVTLLPVAPSVRAGRRTGVGEAVGRVRGRNGLHLGVRRAGDPFGYVDPAPLLARRRPAPPPLAPPGRASPPRLRPVPRAAPRAPAGTAVPLAPWPAWGGLTLVLVGASARRRVTRVRSRTPRAVPMRT